MVSPSRCPPWQPERPGPTRREPRRAQRSYTTRRDTIQPSYAFVEQPQTNGVAERFNRTLKEQIVHGRIYRNIAELRDAVRGFVKQYNAQWIVEKNRYLSPAQARLAWHATTSLRPAA